GGAAICYAASELHGLAAMILESVRFDLATALCTRTASVFPASLNRLAQSVIEVTEERLGVPMHQLTPGRYLAALARTPLLLVTEEHAAHDDGRTNGGDVCQGRILIFLEICLCRNEPGAGGFAVAKPPPVKSGTAGARRATR